MVLVGVLFFLIPLLFACFIAFDRLVRFEYAGGRVPLDITRSRSARQRDSLMNAS
jgi:hypothetical protein